MHKFLAQSIEYANQRSYLDDLFRVYPTIPNGIREVNNEIWNEVERSFYAHDNRALIESLLKMDLFPVKDSYVAYLKNDKKAIDRNPRTINRICGMLYALGINGIYDRSTQPKETNRQMGPKFKEWVKTGELGLYLVGINEFTATDNDAILDASDSAMMQFAKERLNYTHEKGLDLIARFNGKYVIGEAKFLTDYGGHQNAQFNDAIATITTKDIKAITIAVLDGVLYIPGNNKMYRLITEKYCNLNIMSALVLRDFLYSL